MMIILTFFKFKRYSLLEVLELVVLLLLVDVLVAELEEVLCSSQKY
jgi:hypothetical protein